MINFIKRGMQKTDIIEQGSCALTALPQFQRLAHKKKHEKKVLVAMS
jgi:hypothetical protein